MSGTRRHGLKLLNFGLLIYVALGALIFHWTGEFEDKPQQPQESRDSSVAVKTGGQDKNASSPAPKLDQLHRLRSGSVRRMWNITNQLNILYESNWTELILAELINFEQKFVESLERSREDAEDDGASSASELEVGAAAENEDPESRRKSSEGKTASSQSGSASLQPDQREKQEHAKRQLNRRRLKSIKRSLVHSLATITTMGSPVKHQGPRSNLAKLLTVIYGSLGVPLLLVTVSKTGHSLAKSSLNFMLIVRHYCFSVPLHYLCCSCQLFRCLKWLARLCCCCCCCAYLFYCLFKRAKRNGTSSQAAQKQRRHQKCCCDVDSAPKLRLRPSQAQRQKADERQRLERQQKAFVIGFTATDEQQGFLDQDQQMHKSVRFAQGSPSPAHFQLALEDERSDDGTERGYFSSAVFTTSLSLLLAYLAAGSYYLAKWRGLSLVDSVYTCYSMFSASKLPDWFYFDTSSGSLDPIELYRSLQSKRAPLLAKKKREVSLEMLALDSVYLLIGLNLVSTCAQFARLWWKSRHKTRQQCPLHDRDGPECHQPRANGLIGDQFQPGATGEEGASSLMGSLHQQTSNGPLALQAAPNSAGSYLLPSASSSSPCQAAALDPGKQEQIDLAELYVVQSGQQRLQQHAHSHSHSHDASLASGEAPTISELAQRSQNSLCRHHQAALYGSLQRSGGLVSFVPVGSEQDQCRNGADEQQVEQMLRSCLSATKLRPSISSNTLNRHGHPDQRGGGQPTNGCQSHSSGITTNSLVSSGTLTGNTPAGGGNCVQANFALPGSAPGGAPCSAICSQFEARQQAATDSSPNTVDTITSQQTLSSSITTTNTSNNHQSSCNNGRAIVMKPTGRQQHWIESASPLMAGDVLMTNGN